MSSEISTKTGGVEVLKTGHGTVTKIRIGNRGAIAIGQGVLKKAGFLEGAKLIAELMSDGSIVLRRAAIQPDASDYDVNFNAALKEANLRYGDAFRRLAE